MRPSPVVGCLILVAAALACLFYLDVWAAFGVVVGLSFCLLSFALAGHRKLASERAWEAPSFALLAAFAAGGAWLILAFGARWACAGTLWLVRLF